MMGVVGIETLEEYVIGKMLMFTSFGSASCTEVLKHQHGVIGHIKTGNVKWTSLNNDIYMTGTLQVL